MRARLVDGFAIAEEDLRLRGAGNLLGTRQSGPAAAAGGIASSSRGTWSWPSARATLADGLVAADPDAGRPPRAGPDAGRVRRAGAKRATRRERGRRAMRVIAGTARGIQLTAPRDRATRPITDRVKETLFGILGERVLDARVLDLYAGSGAVGIEALSRGAAQATFVEQGRAALAAICDEPRAAPAWPRRAEVARART